MEQINETTEETKVIELQSEPEIKIDDKRVREVKKLIEKKSKELETKLYPVQIGTDEFKIYEDFFTFDCEWSGKQSLGIVEILNRISQIKKDGIKDGQIFLRNLEIEASHYFLNNHKGKGGLAAAKHMSVLKPIEDALFLLGPDNKAMNDLKVKLTAAEQGIELA